jgi:stage III sporulation protein SpoIIIAA
MSMSEPNQTTNDLDLLLEALPSTIQQSLLYQTDNLNDLIEIVMDLGRLPEARYRDQERFLHNVEVTQADIEHVTACIGIFGEDNRAGIPRTLHRISAIRNRNRTIIGLTCRVGRSVFGTVNIIRDIIESGKSILLLGKPGTGKTTLLRETARVLAEELRKRVVVVDTSNEIAGDGDIPHSGIGRARRMQVIRPSEQHAVMIEAVENHMPEVIVIDEIGTELEALAARTIAERGVQLIGTAHGNTLDNLIVNPTLSDLIGGVQTVTLGDEEARRRGTQKTVLERKAPPTFDLLVEIQGWDRVVVYHDVAEAVDAILRGESSGTESRYKDTTGQIKKIVSSPEQAPFDANGMNIQRKGYRTNGKSKKFETRTNPFASGPGDRHSQSYRIFPFGINRNRLEDAIANLHVSAIVVRDMNEATLVMTLKNYYRRSPQRLRQAEAQGVPVYVIRSNTLSQIERQLARIFHLDLDFDDTDHTVLLNDDDDDDDDTDCVDDVLMETEKAITQLINGERDAIEMAPQNSYVRRLQHEMAGRYNMRSKSRGDEPYRRVRIFH